MGEENAKRDKKFKWIFIEIKGKNFATFLKIC